MAFKVNIAGKSGKTFHLDVESDIFIGLKLGDAVQGKNLKQELEGYEFIIKGTSDKAGFPARNDVEGAGLKRILTGYSKGMRERKPYGMRKRKTIRGNTISADIVQINLSVQKSGSKSLEEIFPEQNKKKEVPAPQVEVAAQVA